MTHEHHHGDERQANGEDAADVPGPQPGHAHDATTGPAARPHDEHAAAAGHGVHPAIAAGQVDHAGHGTGAAHDRHEGHSVAMFRDKFWLSLALTIPVVLLSHDIQEWFGYSIPMLPGIEYAPAVLGTIVFFYGGWVFIRGAQGELADRQPGMMTLISLAIVVAFVTSWAGTLGYFEVEIWWELATLITIMLLGHWLEMRSIDQARGATTYAELFDRGMRAAVALRSHGVEPGHRIGDVGVDGVENLFQSPHFGIKKRKAVSNRIMNLNAGMDAKQPRAQFRRVNDASGVC